ncbi:MAG TPA: hypothetical protein VH054_29795 [Polyangiaceae bacterium]|nr:hypothetical protein [Polyangiaceae bacterium]
MKKTLLVACLVLACEATGFEPEYLVDTLRVLAVQADLPLAEPGESVHFTTMWADPNGAGRPIAWAWGTCLNPGSSQIPDCAAAMTSIARGTDSFSVTVPQNALDGVVVGEVGVIFAACAGTITLATNAATGAPVTCTDASGVVGRQGFIWGGTRVTVVNGLRNQNPGIDQVLVDGNAWGKTDAVTLDPNVTHAFTYTATDGSAETYDIGTGPITEQLVGWFYVTGGTLVAGYASPDSSGAFDMTFTPPSDRTRPVHLWLVLRDDRGGLSYTDRTFSWR